MTMPKPLLSLVMIRAAKPEETLAFYRAVGCEFVDEKHGNGPLHHSCNMGTTVLEIYPGETGGATARNQAGATMLGFTVPHLHSTLGHLTDAGVELVTPPKNTPWGLRVTVADPDGRAVTISECSTEFWKARAARGNPDDMIRILEMAPDVPPLPGDEISPENEAYFRTKHGRKA